jgi:hypothetical protein
VGKLAKLLPIPSPIGANWRQMPIGAHTNLPIGANFELACHKLKICVGKLATFSTFPLPIGNWLIVIMSIHN